jgi:hypothetical protein
LGLRKLLAQGIPDGLWFDKHRLEDHPPLGDRRLLGWSELARHVLAHDFNGPLRIIGFQGLDQRIVDELHDVGAEIEAEHTADDQTQHRLEQRTTQLFEVLPEGHRAVFEEVVVWFLEHRRDRAVGGEASPLRWRKRLKIRS